jgi:uncharacterized membrane protein
MSVSQALSNPIVRSTHTSPASKGGAENWRANSVDILRGVVMVLMVVDHVRVFAGVPPGGVTPDVFFTRWITHFCAPLFVFLSGTSAYFVRVRSGNTRYVSRWLATRGLVLIVLDPTLLRWLWTFNADWAGYTPTNVIWAIGWCMVLMSLLIFLPFRVIAAFGLLIVFGHNLAAPWITQTAARLDGLPEFILRIVYTSGSFMLGEGGPRVFVLYAIVPWVGVMALGYTFGRVFFLPEASRNRLCTIMGVAAITLFLFLRFTGIYGDPRPWPQRSAGTIAQRSSGNTSARTAEPARVTPAGAAVRNPAATTPQARPPMPRALAFLNTAKYPASLLFLLMTIGPALLVVPAVENTRGRVTEWPKVFGQVPMFFYLAHIPVIHALAIAVAWIRSPDAVSWLFANHPIAPPPPPPGYMWSLPLLYGVSAAVVILLYPLCKWYRNIKHTSPSLVTRFI